MFLKIIQQLISMTDRRLWTPEEDKIILKLVHDFGTRKWTQVAQEMGKIYSGPHRSSKQIRQRWHNHLDPEINKNEWTEEEQNLIFEAHKKMGSKWKQIAKLLYKRTDNSVKNHFYSSLRRSLRRINKFVGSKNSTNQMRMLKPAILSRLIEEGDKNQDMRILLNGIFHFSKYKPKKSLSSNNHNNLLEKNHYQQAIQNLIKFNQTFNLKEKHCSKPYKRKNQQDSSSIFLESQKSRECLTAMEELSSKENQQELCQANAQVELQENLVEGNDQEFSREDWQESNHGFVVNFPEFQIPEEDHLLMQMGKQQ